MKKLTEILTPDIKKVNELILSCIKSQEDLVEVVGKYLIDSGGKRLRPTLTILCSKLFDYRGNDNIKLAAAVEFIHAATLLHDDVVDNSSMRRSKNTANVVWGNKTSILVGDFLFSQSFKLMVSAGSMEALRSLANAAAIISEGEVMQLVRLEEKRLLSIAEYEQIIRAKTAELFAAACEVGGIVAGQTKKVNDFLKNFGSKLGFIFQIKDDYLDYFGKNIGKNIGDDFAEGKITLPVILAYNQGSDEEKLFWQTALFAQNKDEGNFHQAVALLRKHDVETKLRDYTNRLAEEGSKILDKIEGDSEHKEHLRSLLYYAASRES
jgi:octaprenyl-diphosphate synthase